MPAHARLLTTAALACATLSCIPAQHASAQSAENYPARPIRLVVPFPPGGSTDFVARVVALSLTDRLGQSVVADNRPGAGGNIGTDLVAKAPPDGYTLLWANVAPVAINTSLYRKLPYDPAKDFSPITLAAVFPNVIVVQASFPAKSVKELIALARAKPDQLTYASAGNGSSTHLAPELLKAMAGIRMQHVPYKGGGPALVAVMSGEVSMYFSSVPGAMPHVQSGKMHALGVTSLARSPALPNVPTIAESGLPGFEAINWNGVLAPAHMPAPLVAKLHKEIAALLASPEVKGKLLAQGAEPAPMTPQKFAAYIATETTKWAKIVKLSGARVD